MHSRTRSRRFPTPRWLLAPLAALALIFQPMTGPAYAVGGSFTDTFDSPNTSRWSKADGWSNGGMFNVGWRADHTWFNGGVMGQNLDVATCPAGCSGKPYASGEYRTNELYSYGRFEARLQAVKREGVVTGFFTYTGQSDGQPWDEIDVEILGKNTTQMQTNYFTNGVGGHETVIDLGFDASAGYHDYAIEWWNQGTINWFVDGRLVHQENGSRGPLPTRPMRIMTNLWPGIGVDGWLGPFTYPGRPLTARYDWITYTKY
ncbi:glycoside hydrolase family 16 protein [Streptomyces sp. FL06-04B]|uniref:beta-glucanase n=1 Tax=unclassified Streptomyces TaxID=2593676 RepID=UPI0029B711DD|nr:MULTISPECIES: glycoside hydrolase family 16 protein [unclassified Streptomyces]MDX3610657.1 glycoside hydrolase family 16 protein [Streptomyces sp. FL06-04B]MDX3736945.1 glycoside hydrolase family 16 protein [Streptomyces sp. ID01-15D]